MQKVIRYTLVLVLLALASCAARAPRIAASQRAGCYRVRYLPLRISFMGTPRASWVERAACYVFGLQSPRVDQLFAALASECRIPITEDKWHWKHDVRLEIAHGSERIYLTRESNVISGDEKYLYAVDPTIVNAAFAEVLRVAEKVSPIDAKGCTRPDPPGGCLPCDATCWLTSKAPHLRAHLKCEIPRPPSQCHLSPAGTSGFPAPSRCTPQGLPLRREAAGCCCSQPSSR